MRIRIMLAVVALIAVAAVAVVVLRPSSHGSSAKPTATASPSLSARPTPSATPSLHFPSAFPSAAFSSAAEYCFNHPESCFPSYSPSN